MSDPNEKVVGSVAREVDEASLPRHRQLTKAGRRAQGAIFAVSGMAFVLAVGMILYSSMGRQVRSIDMAGSSALPSVGSGPVKLVEFSDFNCSHCQDFETDHGDELRQLVREGRVTFTPVDLNVFGESSAVSFIAAACHLELVGDRNAWIDYRSRLMKSVGKASVGQDGKHQLLAPLQMKQLAIDLAGGQAERLEACIDQPPARVEKMVSDQQAFAISSKISGTPMLFVDGEVEEDLVGLKLLRARLASP